MVITGKSEKFIDVKKVKIYKSDNIAETPLVEFKIHSCFEKLIFFRTRERSNSIQKIDESKGKESEGEFFHEKIIKGLYEELDIILIAADGEITINPENGTILYTLVLI